MIGDQKVNGHSEVAMKDWIIRRLPDENVRLGIGWIFGAGVSYELIMALWPLDNLAFRGIWELVAVIFGIPLLFFGITKFVRDRTKTISVLGIAYKEQVEEKRRIEHVVCQEEIWIHTYCFTCYPDKGIDPSTPHSNITPKESWEWAIRDVQE